MTEQRDTRADALREVGKSALASIREMVAALECDYERLEELRDEKNVLEDGIIDTADDDDHAPDANVAAIQALADWTDANGEELKDLEAEATIDGEQMDADKARERIQDDALSVRIFGERTDGEWEADKAELLLSTGGPAVRIMVELSNGEPSRAWLEVQDWGTPWTEYYETGVGALCLAYARCFCFE